jgi:hypothetical protein
MSDHNGHGDAQFVDHTRNFLGGRSPITAAAR